MGRKSIQLISEVNNAAFEPCVQRGFLTTADARTMPYNWASAEDGHA
jgi:hypothetical protein